MHLGQGMCDGRFIGLYAWGMSPQWPTLQLTHEARN